MLSVITITFNNSLDLKNTLDSLKGLNVESVIVNGGSCLETLKLLQNFNGITLSEKDRGISDAFNKGIHLSTGDFVTFLNSGDLLIDKNYYIESIEIFNRHPDIDFVYADIAFLDAYAGEIRVRSNKKLPQMPFTHPTLIVRRKVFERVGVFDLSLKIAMDLDFVYRMVRSGAKGWYIPRMVVKMDGSGVSSSKHFATFKEIARVIVKNKDFRFSCLAYLFRIGTSLIFKKLLLAARGGSLLSLYRKARYGNLPPNT